MASSAYETDMRDHKFVLFEQVEVQNLTGPRYADFDQELYEAILEEASKVATETIAPVNAPGDRQGCRWEDGAVRTPDGFKEAYKTFCEAGWTMMATPTEYGGQGLPLPVALVTMEMFSGAGCAFMMYPGLTAAAANLIRAMGSDWMKEYILPPLLNGDWTGTMCLTEPQAGSAVGDVRTKAVRDGDGWLLKGTKIFVSGGEHDLTDNIIHIMLVRTEGAPQGIKGLSLFMVPKYIVHEDGSRGDKNDLYCSGIEHKMGINGSATCTLSIGDNGGARGWIIGHEAEGMTRMFHMMNEARIGVGVQGYALAAAAYSSALEYARGRIQGTDFKEFRDAGARRVAIIEHPDVRRMLLHCRAQVDGMRALGITLASWAEQLEWLPEDDPKAIRFEDLLQVLTPVHKSWCTDQGFDVTRWALQVYGGYGYIGEYPAEQYVRDSKIFSIYEGTNGIQALDLVGRKMAMKGGQSFMQMMAWVNELIASVGEIESLKAEHVALEKGRDRLGSAAMHLMQLGMSGDQDLPVLHACDMLNLVGDVVIAALIGQQAVIAHPKLSALAQEAGVDLADATARGAWVQNHSEARFYQRKIDNLRYFAHQFLPRTAQWQRQITSPDRSVLEAVL
jgi:alkylation response protein AidB-like acyl-CoA dehydrogenase